MNQKSPFEQWRENHLYQIAVSPEVLKLIAEAFQGGRLYEMKPFQKREWSGLTEDDKVLIKHDANFNQFMTAGEYADRVQQLTEARLKDKNT
jgi:hypothetical protein